MKMRVKKRKLYQNVRFLVVHQPTFEEQRIAIKRMILAGNLLAKQMGMPVVHSVESFKKFLRDV